MTAPKASAAKGDVEKKVADETEKGYVGDKVDPTPNEAYTLTTGPDSPPAHEDDRTRTEQRSATQEA